MSIELIKIDLIKLRTDARPVSAATVSMIAESIKAVGQLEPAIVRSIVINSGEPYELIAGGHRLNALRQLGRDQIECKVVPLDDDEAKLVMIDENLARKELTESQKAKFMAQRKAIYLKLFPNTAAGVAGGKARQGTASDKLSFAQQTAKLTGVNKKTIERAANRGENIPHSVLDMVVDTSLDSGVELDALAALPFEQQEALAQMAALGQAVSARKVTLPASKDRSEGKAVESESASQLLTVGSGKSPAQVDAFDVSTGIGALGTVELASVEAVGKSMFLYAISAGIAWLELGNRYAEAELKLKIEGSLLALRKRELNMDIVREEFEEAGCRIADKLVASFTVETL